MVEFMITGETAQSSQQMENAIIKEQLNQIINKLNTKFKQLTVMQN